ncbi:MAG: 50S ribosomal protein L17 [Candidatus Uhrbacteria bacterium GW2011_GWE2_45_35]|uniref:Large ribosomal subunit protein bL17 n=2 Tax=Candidatus Uhriibacteriota TaxID=1752732 RepID=A0A0G1JJK1_9BACT|nr:MAG: 50S ribosomal protein L17 [Candidatus Uhrbacteria bacterium GW2011_GWF2_44_350]KKU08740.1 MAG: 50S ribosomal protein L17 [Candidatus Uhrbacteria bacterium GW2011_GWE2_45_35]HBR80752.1 50S ribosomal protein L17 [Candidatus Uhrbacteria bacterium]HCU31885.1 50S ribosomal protein L17 [Candidatus Uhrbacteria bacterium]
MRHRSNTKILDRKTAPRRALLKSLAESVILYEKIQTTEAKAKTVRPLVEKAISVGKEPTLTARRKLMTMFHTEAPVKKILEELGPRYKTRAGGYTRIIKLGHRKNDAADMAQIELV